MRSTREAETVNDEKEKSEEVETYDTDYYSHEYSGLLEER